MSSDRPTVPPLVAALAALFRERALELPIVALGVAWTVLGARLLRPIARHPRSAGNPGQSHGGTAIILA